MINRKGVAIKIILNIIKTLYLSCTLISPKEAAIISLSFSLLFFFIESTTSSQMQSTKKKKKSTGRLGKLFKENKIKADAQTSGVKTLHEKN